MKQLSQKQEKVLSFIEAYQRDNAMPPTYKEIQTHFGFSSPTTVTDHVRALERKGYLRIEPGKSRNKTRGLFSCRPASTHVPLVGTIAAGPPIEAIENIEKSFDLSSIGITNRDKQFFALTVKGDSMINAHIMDGDIVVVKKQSEVKPHEIAAVLWNNEATIKYVKKRKSTVYLVPANDTMSPITITSQETQAFAILGKVVSSIRPRM